MQKNFLWWVLSLVIIAMASFAGAQQPPSPQPRILSGNDLGFRVEGTDRSGKAIGTFMVRVNGSWVEVGPSFGTRPVH